MKQLAPFRPPYPTDALEPYLGEAAVGLHYELTQGYVNKANTLARSEAQGKLFDPRTLQFQVNGAKLHKLWWENLKPFRPGPKRSCNNTRRVLAAFGGRALTLKKELSAAGMSIEGSGWACLAWNKKKGYAEVITVPDHSFPWRTHDPLLLIDVWEHARILDYGVDRKIYLSEIMVLVDWAVVASRLPE